MSVESSASGSGFRVPIYSTSYSVVSSLYDEASVERLASWIFAAPDCDVLCLGGTNGIVSRKIRSCPGNSVSSVLNTPSGGVLGRDARDWLGGVGASVRRLPRGDGFGVSSLSVVTG